MGMPVKGPRKSGWAGAVAVEMREKSGWAEFVGGALARRCANAPTRPRRARARGIHTQQNAACVVLFRRE